MNLSSNQRYYLGAAAVILAMLIATVVAYPQLPNTVPIHWDAHGQANGWGPRWSLFLWGPGIMAAIVLLFAALPWLSPRKFEVDSFRSTYLYIMIVLVSMLAYIHMLALAAGLGVAIDVGRAAIGGVCLFIALLGKCARQSTAEFLHRDSHSLDDCRRAGVEQDASSGCQNLLRLRPHRIDGGHPPCALLASACDSRTDDPRDLLAGLLQAARTTR